MTAATIGINSGVLAHPLCAGSVRIIVATMTIGRSAM